MSKLTPSQHAQLGCEYLDELLKTLERRRWCFYDTFGIEKKITEHAQAIGIRAPLSRPVKPEHETAEELQLWLAIHDPVTDSHHERLIGRLIFAPPPADRGTVSKQVYSQLDAHEQAEFLHFVERLKRELVRRAATAVKPAAGKLTKEEANVKVRDFLRKEENHNASVRAVADGIGCSAALVIKTPAWRAVHEQRKKGRKPKKAGVVSLTPKLMQVAGTEDEPLAMLVDEQAADKELSPLDDDPPEVRPGEPRRANVYRNR